MRHNLRRGIDRGGEVTSPDGLGNPTPTDAASVAHVPIFVPPVSWCDMSPLWGFGYLLYGVFYKHAAPLGLNAAEFAARYRSWGRGYLAQRVGEPNPYGCSFGCSRSNFRASRILVRHVAPLGLNAAELAARYPSWGRGYLARWVGEPNPYGCSFGCSRSNFRASRILVGYAAPLGLNARICGAVFIVGERLPRPMGWGTQPLRIQLRLLTFQFSCLPYLGAACRPSGAKCLTFPFSLSCFSLLRVLLRLCGESYHVSRLTFHFP